jgi:hypothetical protein
VIARLGDGILSSIAAIAAFASISQLQPDLVINAGTAGGYKAKGAAIGDVFIGSHIRHHDRRIPIPGFKEYGVGDHHGLTIPHVVEVSSPGLHQSVLHMIISCPICRNMVIKSEV